MNVSSLFGRSSGRIHTVNAVRRGFSLMELLVVVGIFSIISLVVLANHSRFNSSTLLGSLAYNIALTMREAQVYGLSVQQYNNSDFKTGYGVHVDSANKTRYIFFSDKNSNNQYDAGTDDVVKQHNLQNQHSILKFCGVRSTGEQCSDGVTPAISFLDVVFLRPNPDAKIKTNVASDYSLAKISVSSPSGEVRTVTVASTGQIVVNPSSTYSSFSN